MAISTSRNLTAPLWILAILALVLFLREARDLCVPIAIAALLSFALAPVVRLLEGARVPRVAAAAILLLGIVGGGLWGAYALGDDVARQIHSLPDTIRGVRVRMQESGGSVIERLDRALDEIRQIGKESGVSERRAAPASTATTALWSGSESAMIFLGNLVVVAFLVFFLLATAATHRPRAIALLRPHLAGSGQAEQLLDEITGQIERFIVVRIATAVLVGVATWMTLIVMGGPSPALWGLLAGVFNSIPFFGPVIVSGGVFVVGLLAQGFGFGAQLALVTLVITTLEGWLLTPQLLGRAARMPTLTVFVGLLLWSWIWGIWGTVLALPLMAIAKAVAERVPSLQPLALLLKE